MSKYSEGAVSSSRRTNKNKLCVSFTKEQMLWLPKLPSANFPCKCKIERILNIRTIACECR
jgi:hypothetical protein